MNKLNIGCAEEYMPGWTNTDISRKYKADLYFDLNDIPYPLIDKSYDVILASHVLEHLQYPKRVIQELRRIGTDNAIFIFVLPNEYDFVQRLYYLLGIKTCADVPVFELLEKNLHIHKPRVKDIVNLFSDFKIIKIEYKWNGVHLPGFLNWIIRGIAPLWPSMFASAVKITCTKYKKRRDDPLNNMHSQEFVEKFG